MARRRRKTQKPLFLVLLLIVLAGAALWFFRPDGDQAPSGDLELTFLDVGQADCILARLGGMVMLVDAGGNKTADQLVTRLQDAGIRRIDVLIGTHPHEDHIGGLDRIIESFPVDRFYMPAQPHTTRTYEDVLDAALEAGLSLGTLRSGDAFSLGGAKVTVLAPSQDEYPELNNASVVCRIEYAGRSVLLTGDAEELSEGEMIAGSLSLKSDVLKVGHHGSSTSTGDAFLAAVSPSVAVISCGAGNSYGHPDDGILQKLQRASAAVYRTDLNGTVRVTVRASGEIEVETER